MRSPPEEGISPPSSGILWVIGFHSCITAETLSISLSRQGNYVRSKNTVFREVFMVVSGIVAFWHFVTFISR
jgi:hypothetical protein